MLKCGGLVHMNNILEDIIVRRKKEDLGHIQGDVLRHTHIYPGAMDDVGDGPACRCSVSICVCVVGLVDGL